MSKPFHFYKASNDDPLKPGREIYHMSEKGVKEHGSTFLKLAEPYLDSIEPGKRTVVIRNASNLSPKMFRESAVVTLSTDKDIPIDTVLEVPPEQMKKYKSLIFTLFPDSEALFKCVKDKDEQGLEILLRTGIACCLSHDEDLQNSGMLKLSLLYGGWKRPHNLIIMVVTDKTNPRVFTSYHTYRKLEVIQ